MAVGDGQQAIERVQADRPDIVLADVGMPERDGYEVAAFIKGDPQLAHIPVLLLTGAFEPIDEVARPRRRLRRRPGQAVRAADGHQPGARSAGRQAGASSSEARPAAAGRASGGGTRRRQRIARGLLRSARRGAGQQERSQAQCRRRAVTPLAPVRASEMDQSAPEPAERTAASTVRPRRNRWPQPAAAGASGTSADARRGFGVARRRVQRAAGRRLQDAFAALLAAEQAAGPGPRRRRRRRPMPCQISRSRSPRRVIARHGRRQHATAVLDAAERLVREEIARIKARNWTPSARFANSR